MARPKSLDWIVGGALALAVGILVAGAFVDRPAHAAGTVPGKAIEHAIGILEVKGDRAAYTKAGKPRVKALETILGEDISAAERDAAWKAFKAPKPMSDTAAMTALNGRVAELESDLKSAIALRHRAEIDLSVKNRELSAALDAHTALQRKAERNERALRAEAAGVKAEYQDRLATAKADRDAAARLKREAQALHAEATKREAGSGPAVSRACRGPLQKVLNAGFTWAGNLDVSRDDVAAARVICLQRE